MKSFFLALAVAVFGFASGRAAISVPVSGSIPFSTLPDVSDWSTRSLPGSAADIVNAVTLDAVVQTNSVVNNFVAALITRSGPPIPLGLAGWSTDEYAYTGPAGVAATLLLATLRNDSGGAISSLRVGYDLRMFSSRAVTTEPAEIPGQRVYFSLTGQAGSWQFIPELSGDTNAGLRDVWLSLGSWPPGALLYLLWAQDAAGHSPDDCFAIDNFYATPLICDSFYWLQPFQNLTVIEGHAVRFSINLCPHERFPFQWYQNDVAIPGATNSFIDFPRVRLTDAGAYHTTFGPGAGTSRRAALTVIPDDEPPRLLLAYQLEETNAAFDAISVFFSEPMETNDAAVALHYWLNSAAASNAAPAVLNASVVNDTNVVLHVGHLTPGVLYFLTVSNLTDQSAARHSFWPDPATVPVQTLGPPTVAADALWRYFSPPTNATFPGWMNATNDDSFWLTGPGAVGFPGDEILPPPFVVRTLVEPLGGSTPRTVYHRTRFDLSAAETNAIVQFSGVFDDGAVVYLNGREVWRVRMPPGVPDPLTLSSNSFEPHPLDGPVDLYAPGALRAGFNILAVEVHNSTPTSGDIIMGLAMRLSGAPGCPPRLTLLRSGSNAVSVAWTCGGTLQVSSQIGGAPGSWQDVVTPANSFTTNLGGAALFFRVRP